MNGKNIDLFKDYTKLIHEAKYASFHGKERLPDKVCVLKVSDCFRLKILTSKQMLQTLATALAQVKPDNRSESLLNELGQTIYYLY